jgi:putative lipoic acid-binding regulatory protein
MKNKMILMFAILSIVRAETILTIDGYYKRNSDGGAEEISKEEYSKVNKINKVSTAVNMTLSETDSDKEVHTFKTTKGKVVSVIVHVQDKEYECIDVAHECLSQFPKGDEDFQYCVAEIKINKCEEQ